jgi:hypothetical protein
VGDDGRLAAELAEIKNGIEAGLDPRQSANINLAPRVAAGASRLVKALEAALNHHQPEQLYGMVEDYKGNVVCPHGPDYDGDLHYEDDEGFWYCKALPTVVVCSSCADGSASDLREQWPCPTYTGIARELAGEPS